MTTTSKHERQTAEKKAAYAEHREAVAVSEVLLGARFVARLGSTECDMERLREAIARLDAAREAAERAREVADAG